PALAESEAGRRILGLGLPDRVRIAAAAYAAWSAAPWGGLHGAGLRRVVSDLLRSKLTLADADAIALARAVTREGFTHAGYSPNQAVFSALERHVAVHGLSPDLRGALEHLLEEMTRRGAEHNAQGRKLLTGVERLLSRQPGAANAIALFKPKPDAWGIAVQAKLAALTTDVQAQLRALLVLAANGGTSSKPAKGWLKTARETLERLDRAALGKHLLDLIEWHEPGSGIALENQETLRGLLWLAAMAAPEIAARRLEAFAQKCLTFS